MPFTRSLLFCALGTVSLTGALTAAQPALAADTITLQTVQIPQYYDLEATLEAVNESTISAQTSGAIKAVYYDVNDEVKAGALLIEIDNTQQQAALAQADAQLAQAQAQNEDAQVILSRNSKLLKQGTLSQGQYDNSVANAKSAAAAVKAAEASLRQSREQLAYTRVTAPYSGIVKARMVQVGELVNPGTPLMTGLALQPLRAVADLPQRLASQYHNADQVSVALGQQQVSASKVTLYPFADAQHHSVRLRAELPAAAAAGQYPGMWTRIRLQTGEREAMMVPVSALVERSEVTAVYVLEGQQLKMRQVRVGTHLGDQVEILAGLSAGDQLATDGYAALAELAASSSTTQAQEH
jgi:membrane fusion protein, multidrug efflux system